ncbi:hypothetical protein MSAN_01510800 [Mycena sanguinolenta]|uniref:Uncharacterized protein n=1 Tax=Mycena sanguinolenta TaxID=230812 RepID=A0A8H7CWT4_9AGAR|nr:hypothetical protein MSAN_01510800 [Mycena sanguinolenta]
MSQMNGVLPLRASLFSSMTSIVFSPEVCAPLSGAAQQKRLGHRLAREAHVPGGVSPAATRSSHVPPPPLSSCYLVLALIFEHSASSGNSRGMFVPMQLRDVVTQPAGLRRARARAGRGTFGAACLCRALYILRGAVRCLIVRAAMCTSFEIVEIVADKWDVAIEGILVRTIYHLHKVSASRRKSGCAPSAAGGTSPAAMQIQRLKALQAMAKEGNGADAAAVSQLASGSGSGAGGLTSRLVFLLGILLLPGRFVPLLCILTLYPLPLPLAHFVRLAARSDDLPPHPSESSTYASFV